MDSVNNPVDSKQQDPTVDKMQDSAIGSQRDDPTTGTSKTGGDDPSGTKLDPGAGVSDDRPSEASDTTGDPTSGTGSSEHKQSDGSHEQTSAEEPEGSAPTKPNEDLDKPNEDSGAGADDSGASSAPGGGAGGAPAGGPPGVGGDDGPKPQTESHGEGTGQKWEKSTGVAADGGDFDATRPGAGREAGRLLDEAGTEHGVKAGGPDEGKSEAFEKPGMMDKIKDKLHH